MDDSPSSTAVELDERGSNTHVEDETLLQDSSVNSSYPITKQPLFLIGSAIAALLLLAVMITLGTLFIFNWENKNTELPQKNHNKTLIIVSLDGFRWDYLKLYEDNCQHIWRIANSGIRAERMLPAFPSKTFPNHYTLVTGLYPESHGIIANTFYDPVFRSTFNIYNSAVVSDGRWWGGEPIWSTAEKQGRVSATLFWPGSEAEIAGKRPTYWLKYDGSMNYHDRVTTVMSWLKNPTEQRPSFISLYLEMVDTRGHQYGPNSPEVRDAVTLVDDAIGILIEQLESEGIFDQVDIIITADHGMTDIKDDRVIFLSDYVNLSIITVVDWSPNLYIIPNDGKEQEVYDSLKSAHPSLTIYWKNEIPEKWHYRNNRRITPIFGTLDLGWSATSTREYLNNNRAWFNGGNHGWDNEIPDMGAIFIARGPSFKNGGQVVSPIENIHVYELMCHILDLQPAPNNGTWVSLQHLLT